MTFPTAPRELAVELHVDGGWTDITDRVYARDPVAISRGRQNESGGVSPASCSLTLDNRSGDFSPRNPLGQWYGSLGRNTPIRVGITRARDSYDRTTSNGWGTSDLGGAWTTEGGSASDYATSATGTGSATTLHSAANTSRAAYLAGASYRDVDVAVTWDVTFSDVTGSQSGVDVLLRRTSTAASGYRVRMYVQTSEAVQMDIVDAATATIIGSGVVVAGLTHDGTPIRVRGQADGQTIRGKAWRASEPEPFGWTVEVHDTAHTSGHVGVRTNAYPSSTNVPATHTLTDFTACSVRFHGEVSAWPTVSSLDGADAFVAVEAGGLRRRLAQGASSVQSALRRSIPALPSLVDYWPMEDAQGAEMLTSGRPDGTGVPMFRSGPVRFGQNSDFAASEPIPVLGGGILFARPAAYTTTGETQVRAIVSVPSGGGTDNTALLWLLTSGTAPQWMLVYGTGGSLRLRAYDASGAVALLDTGAIGFDVDGRPCRLGIELTQNGSNIDTRITMISLDRNEGTYWTATLNSRTVGRVLTVQVNMDGGNENVAVGHVTLETDVTSQFDQYEQLSGYARGNEQAGERVQRLCSENDVPFAYVGSLAETSMGPQPLAPLLDALDDAADADGGTLVESRSAHALVFRARGSLYNASPAATLTYSAQEIAPPFEPLDDDAETRNDVTFSRAYGSSARAVRESGALSVADPADGGAGRYQITVSGNTHSDLTNADHAGWHLHLGTVDEPRIPRVAANLAASAVAGHATLPAELLDVDVDDRIAIDGATAIGFYGGTEQRVLGYSEVIAPFRHEITFNCAPASPFDVPEVDAAEAKVDTEDSTLAAGVTSSATSLSVATTGAHLWTTSAGQMPIPIMVGGEEMSVTAISGSSSPQAFTVTRAQNGVSKAHDAGAGVRLARRPVAAL